MGLRRSLKKFNSNNNNNRTRNSYNNFKSTNKIMQEYELVEGLKRAKFDPWLNKIVEAAQERLNEGSDYITECLRNKREANIVLDRSNKLKSVPIMDAAGVITGYQPIDPVTEKD